MKRIHRILTIILMVAVLAAVPGAGVQRVAAQDSPPPEVQAPDAGQLVLNNSWLLERIDSPHQFVGGKHNLKYDSANYPHIVYGGKHLYHAWRDVSGYHTEIVDPAFDVGSYASLAIDGQDKLHIAYYDAANQDLKYATNQFGSWYIITVLSAGNVGAGTDIAVDQYQDPYFVYMDDTNNHLMFAYLDQGNLVEQPEVISGNLNPAGSFAMAMRNPLEIHVVFHEVSGNPQQGALFYTSTTREIRWSPAVVDYGAPATGKAADITVDSSGVPHVVYGYQDEYGYGYYLTLYRTSADDGETWLEPYDQFIDSYLAEGLALRLDTSNKPHVALQYGGKLYYYTYSTQSLMWTAIEVDPAADTGFYPAIAIAGSGAVGFAYMDDADGTLVHLNHRWRSGGSWFPSMGPTYMDYSAQVGGCSTVLNGPDGNPWVIYSGDTAKTLYIKRYLNNAWTARQEITTGLSGTVKCYHAAAIDGNLVGLLYYTTDNVLYYLQFTCPGATCNTSSSTEIVTGMNVPYFDLAMAGGEPWMVYLKDIDAGGPNLIYRNNLGIEAVGPKNSLWHISPHSISMVRTPGGVIQIAYQKAALLDQLYYLNYTRGDWSSPRLLNSGEVYKGVSLAMNAQGEPAIAFVTWDPQPEKLNLIERTCGAIICTWPTPPAVTDSWGGANQYYYPSLDIEASNRYHLSFVDATGSMKYLKYGLRSGSTTTFNTLYNSPDLGVLSSMEIAPTKLVRISFNEFGELMFAWQQARVFLPAVRR